MDNLKAGVPVKIDKLSTEFCKKVDLDLLETQFYHILVQQYHNKIIKHNLSSADYHKMPKEIRENFEVI